MSAAGQFRQALQTGDVRALLGIWSAVFPHLPVPATKDQAEIAMHRARTEAESVSLDGRAYSHAWLVERSLPSGLPDHLKPRAERLYPRIVEGVGVSINFRSPILKPIAPLVERAVSDAVAEAYADGRTEPGFVRARMKEAKTRAIKHLVGSLAGG